MLRVRSINIDRIVVNGGSSVLRWRDPCQGSLAVSRIRLQLSRSSGNGVIVTIERDECGLGDDDQDNRDNKSKECRPSQTIPDMSIPACREKRLPLVPMTGG